MIKEVDTLLKAINLADYDGVRILEVKIEDLLLLRGNILTHQEEIKGLVKKATRLEAENNNLKAEILAIEVKSKPRLDKYI